MTECYILKIISTSHYISNYHEHLEKIVKATQRPELTGGIYLLLPVLSYSISVVKVIYNIRPK